MEESIHRESEHETKTSSSSSSSLLFFCAFFSFYLPHPPSSSITGRPFSLPLLSPSRHPPPPPPPPSTPPLPSPGSAFRSSLSLSVCRRGGKVQPLCKEKMSNGRKLKRKEKSMTMTAERRHLSLSLSAVLHSHDQCPRPLSDRKETNTPTAQEGHE